MESVLLARIQFGMTIGFHFLFPPITIGLAWFVAWLEHRAWKDQDEEILGHAKLFGKLFAILYILGIASGIVMSLQFGTNWSRFSNFVNGVFGPILVAEVLLAFFMESIFFGIWMFGRNRVNPTLHRVSILLVAVGASISAFWITAADSWMQTPAGYSVEGGRAVLTDFWGALLNPSALSRFLHVMASAATITGFFIAGMSAYLLLRSAGGGFARRVLKVGVVVALLSSLAAAGTGVAEAIRLGSQQPEKVAVFRGIPPAQQAVSADVNAADLPPKGMTRGSFDTMMYLGVIFLAYSLLVTILLAVGKLYTNRGMLKSLLWFFPLPIVATEAGWIAAEVGRQPWIVYKVLRTSDAVSVSVPAWMIGVSLALICLVYVLFLGIAVGLIGKTMTAAAVPQKEVA